MTRGRFFVSISLLLLLTPAPLMADIVPVPAADAAYEKHDFAAAAKLWDAACKAGNGTGCFELAVMYRDGEGVERNLGRMRQLYEVACTAQDGRGCFNLANAYGKGEGVTQDQPRAATYLQRGCDIKYMPACANLGYVYKKGEGVAKDMDRAVALFTQACDNGAGPACFSLSALYDAHEEGMWHEDPALANAALLKGCDVGDTDSCQNLAYHYREGYGVARNPVRAASLLSAACNDATSIDCSMLSSERFIGDGTRYTGTNVAPAFVKVAGVYQAACDDHFAQGCLSLATLIWRTGSNCTAQHDQVVAMTNRALALNPQYPLATKFMARLNKGDCPQRPL